MRAVAEPAGTAPAATSSTVRPAPWLREERNDLAVDRLLDAAGRAFADHGVEATRMEDVARAARCSRGTVYRYFGSVARLRSDYVAREARRMASAVGRTIDAEPGAGPDRVLVTGITASLAAVRADPALRAWFTAEAVGTTNAIAGHSGEVNAMAAALCDRVMDEAAGAGRLRAGVTRADATEWIVRVILSLLTLEPPVPRSPEDEADLVRRFVVPALLVDGDDPGYAPRP